MGKKFKLVEYKAEGPKDDPIILGVWQEVGKFDSYQSAMAQYQRTIELYRRSGAEIIEASEGKAILVSDSDRATKCIAIIEI